MTSFLYHLCFAGNYKVQQQVVQIQLKLQEDNIPFGKNKFNKFSCFFKHIQRRYPLFQKHMCVPFQHSKQIHCSIVYQSMDVCWCGKNDIIHNDVGSVCLNLILLTIPEKKLIVIFLPFNNFLMLFKCVNHGVLYFHFIIWSTIKNNSNLFMRCQ